MKETLLVLLATIVPFGWIVLGALVFWRLWRDHKIASTVDRLSAMRVPGAQALGKAQWCA
jgi:hypothetical protein